ncbi:MAG TPA: amidohydrolase [Chloroflexi bacterium]|nr:amidohydrolase [Chloroflexota bacterium]
MSAFYEEVQTLRQEMIARRRDLHRHPELAFQETRTAGIVAAALSELGLEVRTGVGKTGVVALLEGDREGPTLLIRADMDALPIQEENETDYVSETPGVMHACGHDAHTTIGLAVAKMLSQRRAGIRGRVKFVFQPAEEIGEGARAMIEDGVLDAPRPDFSIGLHMWNELPVGRVAVTAGPCMAAADVWSCRITGYGGHGAQPDKTRDPIVAAAQVVSAVQTIASRNVNPLDMAVVTVGAIHGGDAFNVIPPVVEMKGTIRTYRKDTQALVHRRLHDICEGVASALQCQAGVEIRTMTLAVDNDPEIADRIARIAAGIVGEENVLRNLRTMGSEDMSFLMDDIPGCYFFIGSANAERGLNYPHHNPRFDIDEEAMFIGAAILAEAAASFILPSGEQG